MSVRLQMLQVARLAPKLLGESTGLVAAFVVRQLNPDGGFRDRGGASDLYYTVFGLQSLFAIGAELPTGAVLQFLKTFRGGERLDFVHAACLARCWAMMPKGELDAPTRAALLARIESHRAADGGYHASPGAPYGTAYHAFLALGACQDLGAPVPDEAALAASLRWLRAADGAYANAAGQPRGATPATAAAVEVMRQLGATPDPSIATWLLARCRDGGFCAAPDTPLPDLLSTATALHALSSLQASFDQIREAALDFVDSLWTSEGAFYGSWADDAVDCEYTFYGLLALGHLAV